MVKSKIVQISINYGGHDTSAALSIDNEIVAAAEQERYDLIKHSRNFPIDAINSCLKKTKLKVSQVHRIILTTNFKAAKFLNKRVRSKALFNVEEKIRKELKFKGKIDTFDHHLCHLASAYYPSGFNKSVVLSIDGVGQFETGKLAIAKNGQIKVCKFDADYPHYADGKNDLENIAKILNISSHKIKKIYKILNKNNLIIV